MTLEEKTVPGDVLVAAELEEAIRTALVNDVLPCASAFRIGAKRQLAPSAVGEAADALGIHLGGCQLGLFGYPGHGKGWTKVAGQPVPEGLEAALLEAAGAKRQLACIQLWELAAQFGIPRLQVGFVADKLGIKIRPCQLGAF
ncbi:MAG: hypothetical protein JW892_13830 [Anaerolineae bacterium]|nr:hypothetical protein [Anaerolineae bacterium]